LELFADETSPEVVRQDCVAAVAALCRDHDANQSLFRRERGLTCLKHALTALRDADHTLPSAYAVAVLNCAWGAVANNRKNLARFLAAHGTPSGSSPALHRVPCPSLLCRLGALPAPANNHKVVLARLTNIYLLLPRPRKAPGGAALSACGLCCGGIEGSAAACS
jgi:hypothetical protein